MGTCSYCGYEPVSPSARFCPKCGDPDPVEVRIPYEEPVPETDRRMTAGVLFVVVFAVLFIMFFSVRRDDFTGALVVAGIIAGIVGGLALI